MGAQLGGNVFQQAQTGLTQGMGAQQAAGAVAAQQAFQPMQAGPMTVAGSNLNQYMNPYTTSVIGNLARDTGRAMQMGANQLGAAASRAGAFGGSRHGIAQGQMMGDALRGFQSQAGQLRQAGFQNAQQMAQQDIQNRMAANQQRLGAAGQLAGYGTNLANLGQMGFGMGRQLNQDAMLQGALQRQIQQGVIDAAKQQYAGFQGQPERTLGMTTAALGAAPVPQTTTQTRQPGLFDYLTLGATTAGSIYGR